ncbi:hypothetical protein SAMN05443572_113220 [Myxococcus fulvus]|uniref:Uncharacterized protein n=1 Tax=Myxococcus fulvus TaxID=33 RepID=A0ABY1CV90_MYXFU|nr:hypothetical protein SAMN05443572_113220 [Myxococcus fulvus]
MRTTVLHRSHSLCVMDSRDGNDVEAVRTP